MGENAKCSSDVRTVRPGTEFRHRSWTYRKGFQRGKLEGENPLRTTRARVIDLEGDLVVAPGVHRGEDPGTRWAIRVVCLRRNNRERRNNSDAKLRLRRRIVILRYLLTILPICPSVFVSLYAGMKQRNGNRSNESELRFRRSKGRVQINRGQRSYDLDVESTRRGHLSSSASSPSGSRAVIVRQPSIPAPCWRRSRVEFRRRSIRSCEHRTPISVSG